ncbi:hypothetical protein E2C01_027802 [Portunus trituberculatus]|uniref:Uncharacterized protein n=1 Tax=Portunus trituberculatus TaxID=210409 RepID=A0A5B7ELV7_PORTR|nr:hypothetical protein [Portunus trituberculatus]
MHMGGDMGPYMGTTINEIASAADGLKLNSASNILRVTYSICLSFLSSILCFVNFSTCIPMQVKEEKCMAILCTGWETLADSASPCQGGMEEEALQSLGVWQRGRGLEHTGTGMTEDTSIAAMPRKEYRKKGDVGIVCHHKVGPPSLAITVEDPATTTTTTTTTTNNNNNNSNRAAASYTLQMTSTFTASAFPPPPLHHKACFFAPCSSQASIFAPYSYQAPLFAPCSPQAPLFAPCSHQAPLFAPYSSQAPLPHATLLFPSFSIPLCLP